MKSNCLLLFWMYSHSIVLASGIFNSSIHSSTSYVFQMDGSKGKLLADILHLPTALHLQ